MDVIALARHDNSQHTQQTTADIEHWRRCAGCNMKLADEVFSPGYLYRHTFGQRQPERGGSNQFFRKDTPHSTAPAIHDVEDLLVPHQIEHAANAIGQEDG